MLPFRHLFAKRVTWQELFDIGLVSKSDLEQLIEMPEVAPPETFEAGPADGRAKVLAFVRVRPLTPAEVERGVVAMEGIAEVSCPPGEPQVAMRNAEGNAIDGFEGVLGPDADNKATFDRTFASDIDVALGGGTASLFSYGYTGSGKTHTVLGYGDEPGLHTLAAERLLEGLGKVEDGGELCLVATACEIYSDKLYDLLGPEKVECTLLMDERGQLKVQGPSETQELGEVRPGLKKTGSLAAAPGEKLGRSLKVVTPTGLRGMLVRTAGDLSLIKSTAVAARCSGTSTEHDQSSRSHALFRLEIATEAVVAARNELGRKRAFLPAVKNAMDNIKGRFFMELVDPLSREDTTDTSATSGSRPLSDYTFKLKEFDEPDGWFKHFAMLKALDAQLFDALAEVEAEVATAEAVLESALAVGGERVGGQIVLVDLAGADYDGRDVGEGVTKVTKKESAAINKSLLALKECLRAISSASGGPKKAPFRSSTLTRLLEDAIAPGAKTVRRNLVSHSTMLVCAGPGDAQERMTVNTLRYGQLLVKSASTTKAGKKRGVSSKFISGAKPGAGPDKPWLKKKAGGRAGEPEPPKTASAEEAGASGGSSAVTTESAAAPIEGGGA